MMLYYITDRNGFGGSDSQRHAALLHRIAEAARAGIEFIQLREKDLSSAELELLAREALHVIRDHSNDTKFLINSRADVALAVGADGVHLTADSPPADVVRAAWMLHTRQHPLVGVSAHSVADVQRAEANGASFVVLAPDFEKEPTRVNGIGLTALRSACEASQIPVLALGGVNLTNALSCLNARAAGVAGIRLFQQGDVAQTVSQLRELASRRGTS